MLPITIDERGGEKWIVRRAHPIGQRLSRIAIGRNLERLGPQAGWLDVVPCLGILGLSQSAAMEDLLLAGIFRRFAPHPRKECCEAVVIFLAPLFEWMVMTTGTLNAHAQEELR